MNQISAKLAARFRTSGKYRRPIREEARRIREAGHFYTGTQGVGHHPPSELDPLHTAYAAMQNLATHFVEVVYHHHQPTAVFLAGIPDVQASLPHAKRP